MEKLLGHLKKYLTKPFGSLTLHETSMAHFTSDFLVMGFSFCHKTLFLFCLGSEQIHLVLGSGVSAMLFTGVWC